MLDEVIEAYNNERPDKKDLHGYTTETIVVLCPNFYKKNNWLCVCRCGNTFTKRSCDIRYEQNICCSRKCGQEYSNIKYRSKYINKLVNGIRIKDTFVKNRRGYFICVCECGKEFNVRSDGLLTGHTKSCGCQSNTQEKIDNFRLRYQKFCERNRENKKRLLIGKKIGKLTIVDIYFDGQCECKCLCDCGNYAYYSYYVLSNQRNSCGSCDQKIIKEYTIDEFIGDKRQFVKSIYKRDNYRCYICQKTNHLRCHHLNSQNWAIDQRFDPDNCITLCNGCHEQFHKEYGRGNNTKEQFQQWTNFFTGFF